MMPESPPTSPFPFQNRLIAAAVCTGVMAGLLLWLLSRPGPSYRTQPFLREYTVHKGWTFVRLAVSPRPDGTTEQTTRVRLEAGCGIEQASAISFQFDLYREGKSSGHLVLETEVLAGEVSSPDGQVRFELPPGTVIREKELVRLTRVTARGPGAETRELILRFVTRDDRRMALESNTVSYLPDSVAATNTWSWVRGPGQAQVFAPPGSPIYASIPVGQFEFPLRGENTSQASLIAFFWDFRSTRPVWLAVLLLSGLLGLGVLLVPWSDHGSPRLAAAGFACLFGAISGSYALISPPYDAPDEQDHLLSFLRAAGVPGAQERVVEMAARVHWERWQLNSHFQKFSADDRDHPYAATTRDWATSGLVAQVRSGVGGHYWRSIAGVVVVDSIPQTLLRLRWMNVAVACGFVFFSALMFWLRAEPGFGRPWAPLMLVLMAPVAHLAMIASNYTLVVCSGLLLAGCVSFAQPGRRVELLSWFGAALAAGIAFQCSRSVFALIGFAPVLLLRWFQAGIRGADLPLANTMAGWALIAAGLVLPWTVSADDYLADLSASVVKMGGETWGRVLNSLPFPLWVGAAALTGIVGERVFARLGQDRRAQALRRIGNSTGIVGWGVVVLLIAVVIWFQFEKLSSTATNGRELGALTHVAYGFGRFVGSLGPGQHDYLLSLTFWNSMGLGSLDVELPEWGIDLIGTLLLLGWGLIWGRAARRRDAVVLVHVGILSVACFSYLAAMLLASRAVGYTLIGRYMIIFFTVFLTLCWTGWRPLLTRLTHARPRVALALWASLPLATHLFCWQLILNRFFGNET